MRELPVANKTSPFRYYKDMELQVSKRQDISATGIRKLCYNGQFTDSHEMIVNALYEYRYLNGYLIRRILANKTDRKIDLNASQIRKILRSLHAQGFVIQISMHYMDSEGKQRTTPYIYALTAGGKKYVVRQKGLLANLKMAVTQESPITVKECLNQLCVNQFDIIFKEQYGIYPHLRNVPIKSSTHKTIPSIYQINLNDIGAYLTLFIVSIRDMDGWEEDFLGMMRGIKRYIDKNRISAAGILTICENEHQAMEAQRKKACEDNLREIENFYLCDTTMVESDDILSQLIQVLPGFNHTTRKVVALDFRKNKALMNESKA